MDPDEALRQARAATNELQCLLASQKFTTAALTAAERLANSFGALDTWLTTGGVPPSAWTRWRP